MVGGEVHVGQRVAGDDCGSARGGRLDRTPCAHYHNHHYGGDNGRCDRGQENLHAAAPQPRANCPTLL